MSKNSPSDVIDTIRTELEDCVDLRVENVGDLSWRQDRR